MVKEFLIYNIPKNTEQPDVDDLLLEETGFDSLGDEFENLARENDISLVDIDNDGLREMAVTDFQKMEKDFNSKNNVPSMTTFFDDSAPSNFYDFNSIQDPTLKIAIQRNQIQSWFTQKANQDLTSALKSVAEPLAIYLNAVAVHSGIDVDDSTHISNPDDLNYFSQTLDGRRRIDCAIFAELAGIALKEISGVTIYMVEMTANQKGLEPGYGMGPLHNTTYSPSFKNDFDLTTPPKKQKVVKETKQKFSFSEEKVESSSRYIGHKIAVVYHDESKSLLIIDNASVTFIPDVKNMKETVQNIYPNDHGFSWAPQI